MFGRKTKRIAAPLSVGEQSRTHRAGFLLRSTPTFHYVTWLPHDRRTVVVITYNCVHLLKYKRMLTVIRNFLQNIRRSTSTSLTRKRRSFVSPFSELPIRTHGRCQYAKHQCSWSCFRGIYTTIYIVSRCPCTRFMVYRVQFLNGVQHHWRWTSSRRTRRRSVRVFRVLFS